MTAIQESRTSAGPVASTPAPAPRWLTAIWTGFVVVALLMLPLIPLMTWGVVLPIAAVALVAITAPAARGLTWVRPRADAWDLAVIAGVYLGVVGLYRLAFVVFTADSVAGLFLSFAGGLILGVAGPVVYTCWIRRRPMSSLGC
jgi:uncharacterized protein